MTEYEKNLTILISKASKLGLGRMKIYCEVKENKTEYDKIFCVLVKKEIESRSK